MSDALQPLVMDIMIAAICQAKKYQIRKVAKLEKLLNSEYPGKEAEIKLALAQIGKQIFEHEANEKGSPAYN